LLAVVHQLVIGRAQLRVPGMTAPAAHWSISLCGCSMRKPIGERLGLGINTPRAHSMAKVSRAHVAQRQHRVLGVQA